MKYQNQSEDNANTFRILSGIDSAVDFEKKIKICRKGLKKQGK